MLLEKYSRDVAFVLGIPPSFVVSKSNMTGSTSSSQQGENTHTFSTNAQSICRHLERLLSDVHQVIYGGDAVDFSIVPMPRLTIESMEVIFFYLVFIQKTSLLAHSHEIAHDGQNVLHNFRHFCQPTCGSPRYCPQLPEADEQSTSFGDGTHEVSLALRVQPSQELCVQCVGHVGCG